ncbi:MAG: hypothetical protein IPI28_18935 [Candidatus Omnitrophica bacterium]|nr:hypothetical protein [Candidatus Omnitrophota bacterium]
MQEIQMDMRAMGAKKLAPMESEDSTEELVEAMQKDEAEETPEDEAAETPEYQAKEEELGVEEHMSDLPRWKQRQKRGY